MKTMDDLKDMLHEELKDVVKKGDLSPTELDNVYKAVKTLNYIETIGAMQEYGKSNDYSGRYYNSNDSYRGSYDSYDMSRKSYARRGRDGDGDGQYSEDYSGRRGRDAMGRYTSRDGGYSGHSKEHLIMDMQEIMRTAAPEEKKAIRDCIEKLENA